MDPRPHWPHYVVSSLVWYQTNPQCAVNKFWSYNVRIVSAELSQAQSAHSRAPWVRKFGCLNASKKTFGNHVTIRAPI